MIAWIDPDERLPELNTPVIVAVKVHGYNYVEVMIGEYDSRRWSLSGDRDLAPDTIVGWQPLPEWS